MPPTLEPPVKTAAETASELPSLESAFSAELTKVKAAESGAPSPEKSETKQPDGKVEKTDAKPEIKPDPKAEVKPADTGKKRSALDAALADDVPVVETKDEVTQLLESKDPNWDKARETMKRQSEELKTLRETTKKAAEPAPEILTELKTLREERERLKKENDEYRDSVMALDVKLDPSYRQKQQQRDGEVERVASYVKEAGGDAQAFIDAMDLPIAKRGKHLDAILEAIESTRVRNSIEARLAKIDLTDEELETQVNQPHKSYDDLMRQREVAAQKHAKDVEAFKAATYEKVSQQLPKLSKFMRPAPEDADGAAEYNAQLQADKEKAPTLLSVDPETATVLTFKAARYDTLEKIASERFSKDAARIAELETALAKFEGGEIGFRGNGKPQAKQDWETPIHEAYKSALPRTDL